MGPIVRIYLDSAPVIYPVEQSPEFSSLVDERLTATDAVLVASDLKPLRDNDADLLGDYDRFFEEALNECVSLTRRVLDLATEIRARYGFKTPDSIHLAASVINGCDRFLTNDRQLERFPDIAIDVIQAKF